jgi:hypothetical protein
MANPASIERLAIEQYLLSLNGHGPEPKSFGNRIRSQADSYRVQMGMFGRPKLGIGNGHLTTHTGILHLKIIPGASDAANGAVEGRERGSTLPRIAE